MNTDAFTRLTKSQQVIAVILSGILCALFLFMAWIIATVNVILLIKTAQAFGWLHGSF